MLSPVDGEISEVNTSLTDDLERLSEDPYGAGWLVKVKVTDDTGLAALLDHAAYRKQCEEDSGA